MRLKSIWTRRPASDRNREQLLETFRPENHLGAAPRDSAHFRCVLSQQRRENVQRGAVGGGARQPVSSNTN